ncbi:hypothetical protein JDV02_008526 [Purpureocillium takamizusanense]|uniref:Uncharacterized protein n=1 Tax=Purpureocillium takamizusanense TaxID=2060973 RepID=A0A9Q8QP14_9HYPO|nr:uncharacterized protein JDV02_008526 [Purpureocillium takamizusanense]UNI22661.1 hypothetical protein JDV02_008526 [Purpureocillium takamizusanense]
MFSDAFSRSFISSNLRLLRPLVPPSRTFTSYKQPIPRPIACCTAKMDDLDPSLGHIDLNSMEGVQPDIVSPIHEGNAPIHGGSGDDDADPMGGIAMNNINSSNGANALNIAAAANGASEMGNSDGENDESGHENAQDSDNDADESNQVPEIHSEIASDSENEALGPGLNQSQIQALERIKDKSRRRRELLVTFHDQNQVLAGTIRDLRREKRELQKQLNNSKPRRRTRETWRTRLHRLHIGNPHPLYGTYEAVYKLACRESNTAPHPQRVHPDLVLVSQQQAPVIPSTGPSAYYTGPNPLPLGVISRILRFALYFPGEVVHALSRLDSEEEPRSQQHAREYSLLHRFHVGDSAVSLTYSAGPRLHRLQHIEILWTGSQWLTYPIAEDGPKKFTSRRTRPLMHFTQMPRLRTLVVHLQEGVSATLDNRSRYTRRNYEPRQVMRFLQARTAGQDNIRLSRNLRGLQGIDNIRLLRGMESVQFLDWDRWFVERVRAPVKDQSFQDDINRVVLLPKTSREAARSALRRLAPLNRHWSPSEEHWQLLRAACPGLGRRSCAVVPVRPSPAPTLRSNGTSINTAIILPDSSDDTDSSDEESDGSSSRGSNGSGSSSSGSSSDGDDSSGGNTHGASSSGPSLSGTATRTHSDGSSPSYAVMVDLTGGSDEEMDDAPGSSHGVDGDGDVDMPDARDTSQGGQEESLFVPDPSFRQASVASGHARSSGGPQAFAGSVIGSSNGSGGTHSGESSLFVRSESTIDLTEDTDTE